MEEEMLALVPRSCLPQRAVTSRAVGPHNPIGTAHATLLQVCLSDRRQSPTILETLHILSFIK